MAGGEKLITIEVVYALAETQVLAELQVASGTTARQAIMLSGLPQRFPQIDLARQKIGIFGRLVQPDAALKAGDRVEIYRPLITGPKDARRRRAKLKLKA